MPPTPVPSDLPKIKISPRGASRLKAGHVWVYRSDIASADGIPPRALVSVHDHRGKLLGTALYSSTSQIAIRMLSHESVADLPALLRQRIADDLAYRDRFVPGPDACRLIFSEGDFLPGLIVDRYRDILSLQILTQAWDSDSLRQTLITELKARLKPDSIVERVDPRVRELENLPERQSQPLFGDK